MCENFLSKVLIVSLFFFLNNLHKIYIYIYIMFKEFSIKSQQS